MKWPSKQPEKPKNKYQDAMSGYMPGFMLKRGLAQKILTLGKLSKQLIVQAFLSVITTMIGLFNAACSPFS